MKILKIGDELNLSLLEPSVSSINGYYFTKLLHNNSPVYIELPKCRLKQSIVKSSKKIIADLVIDENLDKWFFNLEKKCKQLIIDKSCAWFDNSLVAQDLEVAFISSVKSNANGSILKVNIKMNILNGNPNIKIFQESSPNTSITIETLNQNIVKPIICIVEILGIKFSDKTFQLDIELKQILLCSEEEIKVEDDLFETCLIQINKPKIKLNLKEDFENPVNEICNEIFTNEIEEIEMASPEKTISIKQPLSVYRELYQVALQKAKDTREEAKVAYLNAKNIKDIYLKNDDTTEELFEISF